MIVPTEDLQPIASILAVGYVRSSSQQRRQDQLDKAPKQSVHGHEVNTREKGEPGGDTGS